MRYKTVDAERIRTALGDMLQDYRANPRARPMNLKEVIACVAPTIQELRACGAGFGDIVRKLGEAEITISPQTLIRYLRDLRKAAPPAPVTVRRAGLRSATPSSVVGKSAERSSHEQATPTSRVASSPVRRADQPVLSAADRDGTQISGDRDADFDVGSLDGREATAADGKT